MKANGGDALTAEDIKTAAIERVFGFELLPAPFVVSHLQLGLLLQSLGAPLSEKLHERVGVYLTNALTPKEVAWFLASYARDAKARMEGQADLPGLATLRTALEEALGLKFTGEDGEHFFRSSLVQTLFYGVFSAWVLWCKRPTTGPKDKFNWHEAAWSLHVPMIKTLFEQLATPSKLQSLGLEEVLNWTQTALNRVERPTFFSNFEEHHAVQYFYEPFLAAYDPVLRKRLGVWFTPPEVVRYIVGRIRPPFSAPALRPTMRPAECLRATDQ